MGARCGAATCWTCEALALALALTLALALALTLANTAALTLAMPLALALALTLALALAITAALLVGECEAAARAIDLPVDNVHFGITPPGTLASYDLIPSLI